MMQPGQVWIVLGLLLPVSACYRGDNTRSTEAKTTEAQSTPQSPPVVIAPPAVVVAPAPAPSPPPSPGITTVDGDKKLAEVEAAYARWLAFEIKVHARNVVGFQVLNSALQAQKFAIESKLQELQPLGVVYAMAATLRFGDVQYDYSMKLAGIPLPPHSAANAIALYAALPNLGYVLGAAKRSWVEVLTIAKRNNVSNKWSRLARETLGREFPSEYPPFHQEIVEGTDAP